MLATGGSAIAALDILKKAGTPRLVFAGLMLTGGKLADFFGRRRIFFTGLTIFAQRRVVHRRGAPTVTGKGYRVRPLALGGWEWIAAILCLFYVLMAFVVPTLGHTVDADALKTMMRLAPTSSIVMTNRSLSDFSVLAMLYCLTPHLPKQGKAVSLDSGGAVNSHQPARSRNSASRATRPVFPATDSPPQVRSDDC